MATLTQLYDALKNADAAGATDDARALADEIYRRKSAFKAPEGSGVLQNVIAAGNQAAYGLAGMPVDVSRMAINLATQPNAIAANVPLIGPALGATQALSQMIGVPEIPENTVGSSRWLAEQGEKLGVTDPAKVKAVTLPEILARGGTEAAALTMAPELLLSKLKTLGIVGENAVKIAESLLGNASSGRALARNAITGGAAGAAGAVAYEVAPEPLKPLAAVLAALTGGVGADVAVQGAARAAGAAAKRTGEFFDPVRGVAGAERAAGRRLAAGLDATPEEAIAAIDAAAPPVSGAKPTLAQATMDPGAATMEAAARRADPAVFEEMAATQNAARVAMLRNVQRTGGAEALAPALASHSKRVDDLLVKIDETAQRRGEQIAADLAAGRKDAITAGDELRRLLSTEREAARRVEGALHEAVDPNGILKVRTSNAQGVHKRMKGQRSTLAKPISGEEAAIVDTVSGLKSWTPYRDLVALKSRIGDEMRAEARTNGRTAKWGRLSQYANAIASDLKIPANVMAKDEAAAVKAGQLNPEDTLVARIRSISDELERNAVTFGTDVERTGAVRGGPTVADTGDIGTAGAAGVRPADTPGGEGVPGAPEDVIDPDVAARLAAANQATIERVNTFDTRLLKPMLARPSGTSPYTMPASQIPGRIFQKGPAGAETVQQYRAAVGDEKALPILEGYAVDDALRVAGRADGTLDPAKLAKWRKDHAESLRSFPALDARLANATTASETAGEVAAARRAQVKKIQKGVASELAGHTDPEAITKIVGNIFGRVDSATQMQQLRRVVRGSREAEEGLRKAVTDHIAGKAIKDATGLGDESLAGKVLGDFIDANETTLKAAGFTNPEIQSMRSLAEEAAKAAAIIKSARPGPSGLNEVLPNLLKFGTGVHAPAWSLYLRMVIQSAGHSFLPFLFGGPLLGLPALIGAGVVNTMRAKGLQSIDELFREALLDPNLARRLLTRVTNRNLKPAVNSFRQQLTRSTLGGAAAALAEDPLGIR